MSPESTPFTLSGSQMNRPAGLRPGSREALAWALGEVDRQVAEQREGQPVAAAGPAASAELAKVAALNAQTHPSFHLRDLADRLGVELAKVKGTGAGGRITEKDVRAAATNTPSPVHAAPHQVLASPAVAAGPTSAFGLNPLVARARQQDPRWVTAAAAKAPAPTLFAGGDWPPFTASGLDPATLKLVPWNARHYMASVASTAEAYQILEAFEGLSPDDAEAEAVEAGYSSHPGVERYEQAINTWLLAAVTKEQAEAAVYGTAADQAAMYGLFFGDR